MVLEFLPLLLVLLLILPPALAPVSALTDTALTRIALSVFGPYAQRRRSGNTRQVGWLRSAHVAETYRAYASKTFLYASMVALAGGIAGAYLFAALLTALNTPGIAAQLPEPLGTFLTDMETLGPLQLFVLLLISNATVGVFGGFITYQLRWGYPRYVAGDRRRRIDSTIKRNVAFIFALSRSGMPFPKILGILSQNTGVYGETAREIGVTVKDIDLFGTDLLTALRRMSKRTPSEELEDLAENLGSVLRSGRSIPSFLRDQYEYFKAEEEAQQEQFLDLLGTLAEAYVTVFVAGPLFLITILVIMGLLLGGTLSFLRAMVYLIIPLSTIGFVIYLDSVTEDIREMVGEEEFTPETGRFSDIRVAAHGSAGAADGGRVRHARNWYRLEIYRTLRPYLRRLRDPFRLLTEDPVAILLVTVPIAAIWVVAAWFPTLNAGVTAIGAYDDPLIQATLFVTGSFALVYEVHRRRLKAIEAAIPDFLDRLASTNEAGMAIVESFGRTIRSDLGALTPELERAWADIQWGAHVENALVRFQRRVETPAITRVVTLTTNAMSATNDIGPVLRIAADEAQASRRLERERRNELLTYLVVVYMAFFVFLVIVVALDQVFIPSIPTAEQYPAGAGSGVAGVGLGGNLQQLTQATKDAYSLLFFHAGIVQGFVSGFVAGQMGEGSVKAGAKHATGMLAIGYLVFIVFA
ncbi:MAG: type II secretion system F family protein [Halodesulfurarchaeum sp.]